MTFTYAGVLTDLARRTPDATALVLDDAEVSESRLVCNALPSLTRTTTLAAQSPECPYGGAKLESGLDLDGDGTLQDDEVSVTSVVCSASGLVIRTTNLDVGSAACAAGGVRIESGIDADGDYALDDAEVQTSAVICEATRVPFITSVLVSAAFGPTART